MVRVPLPSLSAGAALLRRHPRGQRLEPHHDHSLQRRLQRGAGGAPGQSEGVEGIAALLGLRVCMSEALAGGAALARGRMHDAMPNPPAHACPGMLSAAGRRHGVPEERGLPADEGPGGLLQGERHHPQVRGISCSTTGSTTGRTATVFSRKSSRGGTHAMRCHKG